MLLGNQGKPFMPILTHRRHKTLFDFLKQCWDFAFAGAQNLTHLNNLAETVIQNFLRIRMMTQKNRVAQKSNLPL